MTFDADNLFVNELKVGENFPLLIVDLMGNKSTKRILSELNKGFPFATNRFEERKQEYLGPINKGMVLNAIQAIRSGDPKTLGELMTETQKKFDEYLAPACLEDLEAPRLHQVLQMPEIQKFIYGGKGVGSQGDGSAQFICKSKESRERVKEILGSKGFECLYLDLKKS
jgi:galactokinase